MKIVRQKHARGCGIATLAMVLDCEYDDIAKVFMANPFEKGDPTRDFENKGLYQLEIEMHLFKHRYAILKKYQFDRENGAMSRYWPPTPFAPAHIAFVEVFENAPMMHIVAMEAFGVVRDPLTDDPKRLTDYFKVLNVMGLWKI
jgi:hypothetical protein